ncbi:MAG: alpha/beta fold hydrolase [Verrucomicrobia bacterium]|nr:alpha/beta fold hydrolase [Verrucomicrobiota bacterium]
MHTIDWLAFKPLPGCTSPHAQMILTQLLRTGKAPPSAGWHVSIGQGDCLCCEVSTPKSWQENGKCIVLVHGLGGSHNSPYMVRMARKLYAKGHKVVRVNLRGCGSGRLLSKLPYHAGTSFDIEYVLKGLRELHPTCEITLIGFSLGANIALKLAGELESSASELFQSCIAVTPPVDLVETVRLLATSENRLYHNYFLKRLREQAEPFTQIRASSLTEFDDTVVAPFWGYKSASHYYEDASSKRFLSNITIPVRMLYAMDDPFISMKALDAVSLPGNITVHATKYGGHMGFLGKAKGHFLYWLDYQLLRWIEI